MIFSGTVFDLWGLRWEKKLFKVNVKNDEKNVWNSDSEFEFTEIQILCLKIIKNQSPVFYQNFFVPDQVGITLILKSWWTCAWRLSDDVLNQFKGKF